MATKLNLDLRNVQEQVEDNIKRLSELNRRGILAYIGLWGVIYDQTKALVEESASWLDQAEQRGMKLEETLNDQFLTLDNQAAREFKKWRTRLQPTPRALNSELASATTGVEHEIEQRIEQILAHLGIPHRDRLERLSQEIDALSRKLDEQLQQAHITTKQATEELEAALPLPDYDKLNAKTVISQLKHLDAKQLQAVRTYESDHAARTTVLREIDQQVKRDLVVM
ncbi:MAG: phasin family protein [Caldilineaceae bacterium]